jgi:hypothetical protein
MDINYFHDLVKLGLKPIPIQWDSNTKTAISHIVKHSEITAENYNLEQYLKHINDANAIAIKLFAPFGTFDFDLKNTENKLVFKDWFNIIAATNEDIVRKICIETTRNGGYHVYFKYPKLSHKISIAASVTGAEVIAVYTGGLLSYCSPTPGYDMFHNSFEDIEELTDEEYDLLASTAALFNEYKQLDNAASFEPVQYPLEYETTCLNFDANIPDEYFVQLLNDLSLFKVRDFRYGKEHKFVAYLRKGSLSKYSAKVYPKSKRVLLFTTSLAGFPSWADNKGNGDKSWVLTPSRIIYYKNKRDWIKTIEEITMLCDSIGIELKQKPITQQPVIKDRLQFPYDIFPEYVQEYINCHNIQHEYIAAFMLSSLATAIGNTCFLEALDGYRLKPIMYLAVVAHAGGAKSPAMKIAFEHLQQADNDMFKTHKVKLAAFSEELSNYEKDKKANTKPIKPTLQQNIISDATIETVVNVLQYNNKGCVMLADELIGFMNRMNAYKQGDDLQKWLEMWDGSSIMLQRMSRDETKISDYTCNVVGGIQPGVLEILSKGDNAHNGFYHRFLFCYPEPQAKASFEQRYKPSHLKAKIDELFCDLTQYRQNENKSHYTLSNESFELYKSWHDYKNLYYNRATNDSVKGIVAKYQSYCLRFALIIQVIKDGRFRSEIIEQDCMERAIRLTEYFLGNMQKALKILSPESPIDTLQGAYYNVYNDLPTIFTTAKGIEIATIHKLKEASFKTWITRKKELFKQTERGVWEKLI